MFEVICTGENKCYGKEGEKRLLNDNHTITALKRGWITNKFKFVGSNKTAEKLKYKEELMPIKRINVNTILEASLERLGRIEKQLENTKIIMIGLKELIQDNKKR